MDVTPAQCDKSESLAFLLWCACPATRADKRALALAERGKDPTRRIDPARLSPNLRAVLVDKVVGRDGGWIQLLRSEAVRARFAARSAWTHTMTRDDARVLRAASAWLSALAQRETRLAELETDVDYHIEADATRRAAADAARDTASFTASAARAVVLQATATFVTVARQLAATAAGECKRAVHDAREAGASVAAKLHGLLDFILSPRIAQVGRAAG